MVPDDGDGSSVVVAVVGLAVLAVVIGAHALAEDEWSGAAEEGLVLGGGGGGVGERGGAG